MYVVSRKTALSGISAPFSCPGQCTPKETSGNRRPISGLLQFRWLRSGIGSIGFGRRSDRRNCLIFRRYFGGLRVGRGFGGRLALLLGRLIFPQPGHLVEFPQPFGRNRVRLGEIGDIDVEPVLDVEAWVAKQRSQRLLPHQRIDPRAHERREVRFEREGLDGWKRRGWLWLLLLRRKLVASRRGRLGPRLRGDRVRGRPIRPRSRRDLAPRPAREEVGALVRAHAPSLRKRPSLPSKERGRWRFFGSGR